MSDDAFATCSTSVPRFSTEAIDFLRRPVWIMDPLKGRVLHANAAAVALWGSDDLASLLARDLSGVSPAVRTRTASQMPIFASGGTVCERVTLYPGGDAVTCDLLVSGVRHGGTDEEDRVVMLIEATPVGISPGEVRALEALRHTGVLVSLYGADGRALFRNPAALAAYPAEPHRFGDALEDADAARALWAEALGSGEASGVMRTVTAAGPRWHGVHLRRGVDPATGAASVLVDERDMTGEVEAHARARHAADHDSLTGLAGRAAFNRALADAEAGADGYALLLLDLDRFKPVNDEHGHLAGDAVLVAAARRLSRMTPEGATAARLGGDEFAVVLPGATAPERLEALAAVVREAVRQPIHHGALTLRVDVSVGTASLPPGTAGAAAIRLADAAMYHEKRASETEPRDNNRRTITLAA